MNIAIHQVDLTVDAKLVIDVLFRYLTPLSDERRFDWLYVSNPYGQARVWVAVNKQDGAMIGVASAFPRRVYIGEREELCWVLGDFCISDNYRTLGPALQLQRACLAGIDSGEAAFCYDFPSQNMMAVYKRLRIDQWSRMLRLAKPLRVDRKVGELVKNRAVAHGLSTVGNLLLAFFASQPKGAKTIALSLHEGECGKEFSVLAHRIGGQYGVCVQRSAEYLNWRYLTNPLYRYELLTARRDNALVAYVVFTHTKEDATLVDLFGINDPMIISTLVNALIALLRERGVMTVSASVVESHPWAALLQQLSFKVRENVPIVVYVSPSLPAECNILKGHNWFLMQGDRDS